MSDTTSYIERLEAENVELRKDLQQERDYLEYERNKYDTILKNQRSALAEQLADKIELELLSIRDICQYIPENDRHRILRRLDRIKRCLDDFGTPVD